MTRRILPPLAIALLAVGILVPTAARAHVERPSYWPLPGPDCSITPCAGGKVPAARSLASAVVPSGDSTTRVVCQADSLQRLTRAIARAEQDGYDIRPHDHRS